ncbi:MAG: trypsin-like peptidase domain-containing protein, partial [Phascolarctobacterium sp.]|nr:trypsin-like peptidase domain-containing protein [Phascolarctobacterium sp.]
MNKGFLKKGLHIFMCGLLGAAVLIAAGCGDNKTTAAPVKDKPAAVEQQISSARNTPIVAAAKKVGPAVVGITNKAYVRDFFNRVKFVERGTGSGVIYDAKNGLIATNHHVVEGATEIIVALTDGRTVKGKVLGEDAATDLAVVQVDEKNLPVATFGDSDTLQVGEPAIAIGNPLGLEFRGSVTAGVISALNRSIELGERKFNLLQTDAAINPGNSGGALVNADGEVIGINSAKIAVSGVEGIGFAIPINTAKPILDQLADKGRVARPYLGASLIDKEVADRFGFDLDLHGGVFIAKVVKDSPA